MSKVYVVTGCGQIQNLGYKICQAIKASDADNFVIAIVDPNRNIDLDGHPGDQIIECDLSNLMDVESVGDDINRKFSVDVLINVAGYNTLNWFENVDWAEHEKMMRVNCTAPCVLIQTLLGNLSFNEGTVLNIVSMGALRPFRSSHSYNVSKAAFDMATRQIAREATKRHGVTVFGISPNDLEGTGMTTQLRDEIAEIRGWSLEEAEAYRVAGAVNPRMTKPESLAEYIAFILADKERHHQFSGVVTQYGI